MPPRPNTSSTLYRPAITSPGRTSTPDSAMAASGSYTARLRGVSMAPLNKGYEPKFPHQSNGARGTSHVVHPRSKLPAPRHDGLEFAAGALSVDEEHSGATISDAGDRGIAGGARNADDSSVMWTSHFLDGLRWDCLPPRSNCCHLGFDFRAGQFRPRATRRVGGPTLAPTAAMADSVVRADTGARIQCRSRDERSS
jgi:hypothetical protein